VASIVSTVVDACLFLTLPLLCITPTGECKGRLVDPKGVCYLGNQNNLTEDVKHRLDILQLVLDRIRSDSIVEPSPDIDHSNAVLKIVMLPEFFFRGPFGAYSLHDLYRRDGILLTMADQVNGMIDDTFFQNYLFVLGTVIAASARSSGDLLSSNSSSTDIDYFNFSPVHKGGPNHKHHFLVTKHVRFSSCFCPANSPAFTHTH
jgi:hypothetical protein